eukprot:358975-Chlamydomonas_euryale.AAC.7
MAAAMVTGMAAAMAAGCHGRSFVCAYAAAGAPAKSPPTICLFVAATTRRWSRTTRSTCPTLATLQTS